MRLPLVIITVLTLFLAPVIQVACVEEEYGLGILENEDVPPQNNDDDEQSEYPEVSPASSVDYDGAEPDDNGAELLPDEALPEEDEEPKEQTGLKAGSDDSVIKDESNIGTDDCGPPPTIERAKISSKRITKYTVGDTVSYVCQFGYVADGPLRYSHCVASEDSRTPLWTNPEINCVPRSCGDPGSINNGYRVGSIFSFPNSVSFECDEGYELRGRGIRYCQTSGSWSGTLPTCERIFCTAPSDPENGRVFFSSLEFGSTLKYECADGYLLRGLLPRVCSENATWSGFDPYCEEAKCAYPEAPEHGSVQLAGGEPSIGSLALYKCEAGRTLIGSTTSRCLDEGIWTFPTPKCVEPCSVPKLFHGTIGKYVKHYWSKQKRLETIPVGTAIKDGEELYLTCDEKYEPLGKASYEEKITCSGGKWSEEPQCLPASCRGAPPFTANVKSQRINKNHGGNVVYHCNDFSQKTAYGNVTCHFGNWRGRTPVCTDRSCNIADLNFPGMKTERKQVYKNNEGFHPSCDENSSIAKQGDKIICKDGEWKGHFPPCIPASCEKDPPSIEHGEIKILPAMVHSSIVQYECDEYFHLVQDKEGVKCHFGEWIGTLPTCQDSRCYSNDLKKIKGISDEIETVTLSGEYLEVKCVQGFSVRRPKPLCLKGEWIESSSPCIENGCLIEVIPHGQFTVSVIASNYWGTEWTEYHKVPLRTSLEPDEELLVSCNRGYTFQGKGSNDVRVKCNRGKWKPKPVCLVNGEPYQEEEITTTRPFRSKVKEQKVVDSRHSVSSTSIHEMAEPESQVDKPLNHRENVCTCTYQNFDANLIAHAGNELLRNGIKVKNNCTVRFQCKNSGIYRLKGPEELICKDCRDWHSSEYPDCVNRTRKPGVKCQKFREGTNFNIIYDNGQEVNSSVIFSCKSANKKIFGASTLTCLSNGQWSGSQPQCKTQCPKLPESEGLSITYTMGLDVFSKASFHCFSPRIQVGASFARCKSDGQWSATVPTCSLPSCSLADFFDVAPENVLPDMTRVNNDTLPYDFTLHLTCENNMMLIGSNTARCGAGGAWEVHKVECVPGCAPLTSDKSTLIVEPEKEFYRFGDSVTFSCPEDQELDSEVVRIMCLLDGWSEERLPNCQDQVKKEIESTDPMEA